MPDGSLAMWYSTRGSLPSSIGLALDPTGIGDAWTRIGSDPVLTPDPSGAFPAGGISRPSVLATPEGWRMWYSTTGDLGPDGVASIGTATSPDTIHWQAHERPVLSPSEPWEMQALQCPNVLYDASSSLFRLWYSGGDLYEPDAIGYATSTDGVNWTRHRDNPIVSPSTGWEDYKLGSFQVRRVGDWHYAFYNAFQRDPFTSRIGMARSRDGVTDWEKHPDNPILAPGEPCSWNGAMVYKPTALWDDRRQRWDLWFNASMDLNGHERIGHAWSTSVW
jgi:predicted GH43/DUF377 family glycosyl hydrolase